MSEIKAVENQWNHITDSTSIEKCVSEIQETYKKSTKVVGWYYHPTEVRGPFCRWITVSDVAEEYQHHVAQKSDEAKFIAACMNYAPKLAQHVLDLEQKCAELENCLRTVRHHVVGHKGNSEILTEIDKVLERYGK